MASSVSSAPPPGWTIGLICSQFKGGNAWHGSPQGLMNHLHAVARLTDGAQLSPWRGGNGRLVLAGASHEYLSRTRPGSWQVAWEVWRFPHANFHLCNLRRRAATTSYGYGHFTARRFIVDGYSDMRHRFLTLSSGYGSRPPTALRRCGDRHRVQTRSGNLSHCKGLPCRRPTRLSNASLAGGSQHGLINRWHESKTRRMLGVKLFELLHVRVSDWVT